MSTDAELIATLESMAVGASCFDLFTPKSPSEGTSIIERNRAAITTVQEIIEERDALRALCQTTHAFLTHGYWGTIDYMEGTEIYGDLKKHAALLALATTPTQDKAND